MIKGGWGGCSCLCMCSYAITQRVCLCVCARLCISICVCALTVAALILLSGVMQEDKFSGIDGEIATEIHRNNTFVWVYNYIQHIHPKYTQSYTSSFRRSSRRTYLMCLLDAALHCDWLRHVQHACVVAGWDERAAGGSETGVWRYELWPLWQTAKSHQQQHTGGLFLCMKTHLSSLYLHHISTEMFMFLITNVIFWSELR